MESQTSSTGEVIEETQVHDLPLNGRDFVQLAYLSPGVNQGEIVGTPCSKVAYLRTSGESGSIHVNGLMATNNNFLLNGFDNNEQQIGFEVLEPPVEAIDEFKVQTSNFGADIGKGGAVVNVVIKSGTKPASTEALLNFCGIPTLDAKNFFDDPNAPIAPFKQNQFGGTIGGPIFKNKTFFFADYQGTRIRQAQTLISIVPSPSEVGGNFSDLLTGNPTTYFHPCAYGSGPAFDPGTIFDPFSNYSYTCGDGTPIT